MAYDIPDEIKYREKIIFNLDWKQLGYAVIFGLLSFFSYSLIPITGELRFVVPAIVGIAGIGFIFLNIEEKIKDVFSYYSNIRKEPFNSKKAQKFFEVKDIRNNIVYLEDRTIIAILEIQPINFNLLDEDRKAALLVNYRAFLNQLQVPIQILIRTKKVSLDDYFNKLQFRNKDRADFDSVTYDDFKTFEDNYLAKNQVKEREYFLIIPLQQSLKNDATNEQWLEDIIQISMEKLLDCGLISRRLEDIELIKFFQSYATSEVKEEPKETKLKKDEESQDYFRNMITPYLDITKDHAIVNGEYHRLVKVVGYPRKVENGWLQSFLSKNENYDISIHVTPSSINSMLVYLHNQIIQQTGDLFASTMKGTPNSALEIKKADTMRVYDSLYKGEEKLFRVSVYIDNKSNEDASLDLLTEKCKSNLNAVMMIPKITEWRMADGVKSILPLAKDKLALQREFLTSPLVATFPFISPVGNAKDGMLVGHELETDNPIFIDLDKMTNKHFFVIGVSGSGKSYTSKYILMQQLFREDTKIYILDPNGEYKGLCNTLNGQVVELSRESTSIINLFDLAGEDFGTKMLSLISAFDIIVGGLTESQKAVLNKAFTMAYAKKGIFNDKKETWNREPPTFTDMRNALLGLQAQFNKRNKHSQDYSLDAVLNRVEMYSSEGIFGFLDKQSRIDVEKKFVCFDLSKLPNAVKNLMMFATLELIQREIKKDTKAKVVIIDEGWSLLRSKEAANYILDFIKTSRKFNASLGFITQEIEDLIGSRSGRSILNTASMKILMRQNPSNIDLISKTLRLNDVARNFLLSAHSGHGLLITEQNIYEFIVKAPPKIHELITTNPKEITQKAPIETIQKPSRELTKGLYLVKDLSEEERVYLLKNGYVSHKDRLTDSGGSSWWLLKRPHNQGPQHSFLCWATYYELLEHFKEVNMSDTSPGDVTVKIGKKRIAFEIETGSNYIRDKREEFEARFDSLKKNFDEYYIVVTDWNLRRIYNQYGHVITRNEVLEVINSLAREGKKRKN